MYIISERGFSGFSRLWPPYFILILWWVFQHFRGVLHKVSVWGYKIVVHSYTLCWLCWGTPINSHMGELPEFILQTSRVIIQRSKSHLVWWVGTTHGRHGGPMYAPTAVQNKVNEHETPLCVTPRGPVSDPIASLLVKTSITQSQLR